MDFLLFDQEEAARVEDDVGGEVVPSQVCRVLDGGQAGFLAIDGQRSSPGKSHQRFSSRCLPVEARWLRRVLRLVYRFIKGVTEMPWMTIETATAVSVSVIACSTTGPDSPWLRANIR